MKGNEVFAKRIKKLREERGESQEDLAKLVGYKKQAISHWEISGKVPRSNVLEFLAKHYMTTSDYLLGIDSNHFYGKTENPTISSDELELLKRYRMMKKDQKDTIRKVAETIAPFNVSPPKD